MGCLTAIRFNMKADILRQVSQDGAESFISEQGEWVTAQHPESGEILRKWQATEKVGVSPNFVDTELETFKCIARGFVDGGIRVAGTTERWGEMFESVDFVIMSFSSNVSISKRDRITNIRDAQGNVIWKEDEIPGSPPTIFDVSGVTPIPNPMGRLVEYQARLERSQIQ